jgi:hypothetical protein
VVCEDSRTGKDFGQVLDRLLDRHKPDLVIVDPALAYLGGDALKQADVTAFCRNILNPIIHRHQVGLILVHHTNKPPKADDSNGGDGWKAGDLAYLGQGAADWANWARGVIAIRSVGSHSVFKLCLGKRGGRVGWKDADGKTLYAKDIAHAKEPGTICWREPSPADAFDAAAAKQTGRPKKDWNAARAAAVAIAKEAVRTKAQLLAEILKRVPDVETEDQYAKQIRSAIDAEIDNGPLEYARVNNGTKPVHLIGPKGMVKQEAERQEKAIESAKQRTLENT